MVYFLKDSPPETLHAPLLFPIRATFPAYLILDLITRTRRKSKEAKIGK
jgi:hypothetical protein